MNLYIFEIHWGLTDSEHVVTRADTLLGAKMLIAVTYKTAQRREFIGQAGLFQA